MGLDLGQGGVGAALIGRGGCRPIIPSAHPLGGSPWPFTLRLTLADNPRSFLITFTRAYSPWPFTLTLATRPWRDSRHGARDPDARAESGSGLVRGTGREGVTPQLDLHDVGEAGDPDGEIDLALVADVLGNDLGIETGQEGINLNPAVGLSLGR